MTQQSFGITALGLAFPTTALRLSEFACLRGTDANKYLVGLGCEEMAVNADGSTVPDLAVRAARQALSRWSGDINDIGMIAVGTESAHDFSRPISAWVAQELGIKGHVRSYEVKHACLGGTLAVRQALEWKLSGMAPGQVALVIAADIALYAPASRGEPTQGAGAVAMIIGQPDIAEILPQSYAWSKPAYDFWRPMSEKYPRVDGPLSLECYIEAAHYCFKALCHDHPLSIDPRDVIDQFTALCFHVPFPKITFKTIKELGQSWGWPMALINEIYQTKINPYLRYNRLTGNSYTASLWVSVAHALAELKTGQLLTAFSYGSGCGAELLTLRKSSDTNDWQQDLETLYKKRQYLTAEQYDVYRQNYEQHNYLDTDYAANCLQPTA